MNKIRTEKSTITESISSAILALLIMVPLLLTIFNCVKTNIYSAIFYYVFAIVMVLNLCLIPFIFHEKSIFKPNLKNCEKLNILPLFLLAGLIIWATISTFFAPNFSLAFLDFQGRQEGLLMYYVYAITFITAFSIKYDENKELLVNIFVVVSLFVSLFMLIIHYVAPLIENLNYWPYSLPFKHPNHAAYFLVIGIILSLYVFIWTNNEFMKWTSTFAFFFSNTALCLNNTFGAQLAVLVSMLLAIYIVLRRNKKDWLHLIAIWFIFITSCIMSYSIQIKTNVLSTVLDNYLNLFKDIGSIFADSTSIQAARSGSHRWELWVETFKNMREHPIFGIGINCQIIENQSLMSDRPHNEVLQFASTMGIPAGLLYISALVIILIVFLKQLKKLSPITTACIMSAIAYFISSLFGVSMPYTFIYYILFLGLGLSGFRYTKDINSNKSSSLNNKEINKNKKAIEKEL